LGTFDMPLWVSLSTKNLTAFHLWVEEHSERAGLMYKNLIMLGLAAAGYMLLNEQSGVLLYGEKSYYARNSPVVIDPNQGLYRHYKERGRCGVIVGGNEMMWQETDHSLGRLTSQLYEETKRLVEDYNSGQFLYTNPYASWGLLQQYRPKYASEVHFGKPIDTIEDMRERTILPTWRKRGIEKATYIPGRPYWSVVLPLALECMYIAMADEYQRVFQSAIRFVMPAWTDPKLIKDFKKDGLLKFRARVTDSKSFAEFYQRWSPRSGTLAAFQTGLSFSSFASIKDLQDIGRSIESEVTELRIRYNFGGQSYWRSSSYSVRDKYEKGARVGIEGERKTKLRRKTYGEDPQKWYD